LPDGFFLNQKSQFGNILEGLDGKMLIYFSAFRNILRTFGIFYYYLVLFVFIWYIFSGFGIVYQEKSGNPARFHEDHFKFFTIFSNKKERRRCDARVTPV
jgi:uncharacterized membrane protein